MPFDRDAYYTPAWYRLKDYALARDAGICCNCGWAGARVVHHLTYTHAIICPHEFLVTLCEQCHRFVHGRGASLRDHYEVHQARRGYALINESEPGCRGEWIGKGRFRYWAYRGGPFCLEVPPLHKVSGDWHRILADATQRYLARPSSEQLATFFRPADEEESAWERYYRWGTCV